MGMSPRLLRPRASGGFKPDSISGIVHWWDANDSATVTLVDGAASEWKSKAGTLTTATQTTANNRPTTTTVNGKTALRFDGTNDGLDFTGTARTDETWFVVAEQLSNQLNNAAMITDNGAGYGLVSILTGVGGLRRLDSAWGGFSFFTDRILIDVASNAPMPATVWSVVRSSAAGQFFFRDGAAQVGVFDETSLTDSKSTTMSRIGYLSSSVFQWDGWIGEILLYDRPLASAERLKVERYLGKKWGITVA